MRGDYPGRLVRDAMLPLSEELIVSADMAIAELIPRMRTLPCRLILRGDRIDGLVTHSDLLKLPVRIVVFGLLTHLETVMADLVSTHWPADEWLTALGPGRRAKLLEKETVLRQRGLNPPRIELTEFADKRDLCKRLLAGGGRGSTGRWTSYAISAISWPTPRPLSTMRAVRGGLGRWLTSGMPGGTGFGS